MAEIVHRPAESTDIAGAADLFVTSVIDLTKRHGLPAPPFTPASIEPVYHHIHRTGIFQVAESEGRMVAIAHAIVRDHLWFLSGFWVLPGLQRRGIGGPLLAHVRAEGERRGGTLAFTWSSIDVTAMASYMKLGMLPGYQILTFAGPPKNLPARDLTLEVSPLTVTAAADIDAQVRATRREVDHQFWLATPGNGHTVSSHGHPIGYYYSTHGVIGPAAWLHPTHAAAVLAEAFHTARSQSEQLRIAIPGINHTAIQTALSAGLRLVSFTHLLRTADPGQMDQYIPSGPSLF